MPEVFHGRAAGSCVGPGAAGMAGMMGVVGVVAGGTGSTGAPWPATGAAGEIGAAGGGVLVAMPAGLLLLTTGCDIGTSGVAALPVLTGITDPLPAALEDPELLDGAGCALQPNSADTTANMRAVLTAHSPAKGLHRTLPALSTT